MSLHESPSERIPVPSSPAEERNDLEIWWIFPSWILYLRALKSVDFINFRSPQRWSPQTCTVVRGDPCHFVDAVNEFTLIWFANLAWMKQSRYIKIWCWIFLCWSLYFKVLISASFGLRKGPPQTCTVARGDPSHFVDALKGFTLMAWMKQSRSDVGIFFVEAFKVRPTKEMYWMFLCWSLSLNP